MSALYGGVALFLLGRLAFLRLSVGTMSLGQAGATGVLVLLMPLARLLPAGAALGVLTTDLLY